MKGQSLFLGEIISENTLTKYKIFFSSNTVPISTKFGTKHPLVKEIHVNSNEVPRPFQSRNNYVIAKIDWRSLKLIFSKETLGQFQPTLKKKDIQINSNEVPRSFQRRYDYEIAKKEDWQNIKIFFCKETLGQGQIQPNFPQSILSWKRLTVLQLRIIQFSRRRRR